VRQVPAANWAESYHYSFKECLEPASADELREIVARSTTLKAVGSGHSFNGIADGHSAIRLARMPANPVVESNGREVSVGGHWTYGDLAEFLHGQRLAIHNLASLPHISIAGAIATATHGSGDGNGNLATAVAGIELVTADGNLVNVRRGDAGFDGMVVHLGALAIVTRVTLDVRPEFEVAQSVYENLAWDQLLANLDPIMASGYSVSVFTQWAEKAGAIWLKRTAPEGEWPEMLHGAICASINRHPIIGLDASNSTEQLGRYGRWSDRLPHFKMGFTPSSGAEIQSEFHVARQHGPAAIEALLKIREHFAPLIQAGEFRTVAADTLWLSPQYRRDTLSMHFTWVRDQDAVNAAVRHIEAALQPFEALPHWGKVFNERRVGSRFEKFGDFVSLRNRMDPQRKFSNPWLDETVFGDGAG